MKASRADSSRNVANGCEADICTRYLRELCDCSANICTTVGMGAVSHSGRSGKSHLFRKKPGGVFYCEISDQQRRECDTSSRIRLAGRCETSDRPSPVNRAIFGSRRDQRLCCGQISRALPNEDQRYCVLGRSAPCRSMYGACRGRHWLRDCAGRR